MKVLDLGGACGHVFEGWFASEQDYQRQLADGLLACPVCDNRAITKRLSAPRLNLGAPQQAEVPASAASDAAPAMPTEAAEVVARQHAQARFWQAMKEVAARTEDVGERFALAARRMHQGDEPTRAIRGQTTVQEARALLDEGIDIVPLPDLPVFKTPLQ